MTSEENQLQAELEAMQRRVAYCQYLLRNNSHKLDESELNEWTVALCQWSNLLRVLEYDLGDIPVNLH